MMEETQHNFFVVHQEALVILAKCVIAISAIFLTWPFQRGILFRYEICARFKRRFGLLFSPSESPSRITNGKRQVPRRKRQLAKEDRRGLKQQQTTRFQDGVHQNGEKPSANYLIPDLMDCQTSKQEPQEAGLRISTKGPIQPNMSAGRNHGSILQNANQRFPRSKCVLCKDFFQDSEMPLPSKGPSPSQMNEAESQLSFPRKSFQEATQDSWAELDESEGSSGEDETWSGETEQEKSHVSMSTAFEPCPSLQLQKLTVQAMSDLEFHIQLKEIQHACGLPSFVQDSLNAFAPFPPDFEEHKEESLNETGLRDGRKVQTTPPNLSFLRSDMADVHKTLMGDFEMHPAGTASLMFLNDKARLHTLQNHRWNLSSHEIESVLPSDPLPQPMPKHTEQWGNSRTVPIHGSMGFENITQVKSCLSSEAKECLDAHVPMYRCELPKLDQQSLRAVQPHPPLSLTHDGQAPVAKSCQKTSPPIPVTGTQIGDDSDSSLEEDWLKREEMEKLNKKSEVRREAKEKMEGLITLKTSMFPTATQGKAEGQLPSFADEDQLHIEPNWMQHEAEGEKVEKKEKEDHMPCGNQTHKMSGAFMQKETYPSSGSEGPGEYNSGHAQGRETTPWMATEEPSFLPARQNQLSQATREKCSKVGRKVSQRGALEKKSFQRPVINLHPKQTVQILRSKCLHGRRHPGTPCLSLPPPPWARRNSYVSCWLETLPGLQRKKYPNAKTTRRSKGRKMRTCFSTSQADESHNENSLEPMQSPQDSESDCQSAGTCKVPRCQCTCHFVSPKTVSSSSVQSLAQQGREQEEVNRKAKKPEGSFSSLLSEENETPKPGSVKQGEEGFCFPSEGNGAQRFGLRDGMFEGSSLSPGDCGSPNPASSDETESASSFIPLVDNGFHISNTASPGSCQSPGNMATDNNTGLLESSGAEQLKGLSLGSVSANWHNLNPTQLPKGSESAGKHPIHDGTLAFQDAAYTVSQNPGQFTQTLLPGPHDGRDVDGECQRAFVLGLHAQTYLFVCLLLQLIYTYTVDRNRTLYRNDTAKVDGESVSNSLSKKHDPLATEPMTQLPIKCKCCGGRGWVNGEEEIKQIRNEGKGKVDGEEERAVSAAVEEAENEDRGNRREGDKLPRQEPNSLRSTRGFASEPLEASQVVSVSPSSASPFREPQSILGNTEMYKKAMGPPSEVPGQHVTPQLVRHGMSKAQVLSEEFPKHVAVQKEREARAVSTAVDEVERLETGRGKEGTDVGVSSTMKTQHRGSSVARKEEDLSSVATKGSLKECGVRKGPSVKQKRANRGGELLKSKQRQPKEAMRQDHEMEDNALGKEQFVFISRTVETKLELRRGLEIWRKHEGMSNNVWKTKPVTLSNQRDASSSEDKVGTLVDGCKGGKTTLGEPSTRKAEGCSLGVLKLCPMGQTRPTAPFPAAHVTVATGSRSASGHVHDSHGNVLQGHLWQGEPPVCPAQLSEGVRSVLRLEKVENPCCSPLTGKNWQKRRPQAIEKSIKGECGGMRPLIQHGVSQGSGRTRRGEVARSKEVQFAGQSKECCQPQNKGSENGMKSTSIIHRIWKTKLHLFDGLKKVKYEQR